MSGSRRLRPASSAATRPPRGLACTALELATTHATDVAVRRVLACAEGHAVIARGLGVTIDAAVVVMDVAEATIAGLTRWRWCDETFTAHLLRAVAVEAELRIKAQAVRWDGRVLPCGEPALSPAQVGALAGLLRGARYLGVALVALREGDGSLDDAARRLAATIRGRLAAAVAGNDDDGGALPH